MDGRVFALSFRDDTHAYGGIEHTIIGIQRRPTTGTTETIVNSLCKNMGTSGVACTPLPPPPTGADRGTIVADDAMVDGNLIVNEIGGAAMGFGGLI
jgi:hypothetical protein